MIRWKDFLIDDNLGPSLVLPEEVQISEERAKRATYQFGTAKVLIKKVASQMSWNPTGNIKDDDRNSTETKGFVSDQETTTSKTPRSHLQDVDGSKTTQDELDTVGTSLVTSDTETGMEAGSGEVNTRLVEGE